MLQSKDEFRKHAHKITDWICDYLENIEQYPVQSKSLPGSIKAQIPEQAPQKHESLEAIFQDFKDIILPGMTHWQHPKFMAYFPGNSSQASLLAEFLCAGLGAQCMSWQTSPAATELEERVMDWLRQILRLPTGLKGVIESGASIATFTSLLSAREKASNHRCNHEGLQAQKQRFTAYASSEAHSSIERAVRMSGLGDHQLRKIPVDDSLAIDCEQLRQAVMADLEAGHKPLWVCAVLGSTSTTAVDPIAEIAKICKEYGLWLHVDAAYLGPCLMLPEFQYLHQGLEQADSIVLNPHKWLFTNFDCTAYFVKDQKTLMRTYAILPEYLKTNEAQEVNNYRDWGPALGRRFRALKLWFVLRNFGRDHLQAVIRNHISFTKTLSEIIHANDNFEILAPVEFNLICFRFAPQGITSESVIEGLNKQILQAVNASGELYISHSKVRETYSLRIVIGQTDVRLDHALSAWELIEHEAKTALQMLN